MSPENHERIAERIKQLRLLKGLTQDDLSKQLNISRSAYTKLETGETHLSYEMAIALSQYHKVGLEFFYSDNPIIIQQQHNQTANGYIQNQHNQNGLEPNAIVRMMYKMQELIIKFSDKLDRDK